jgi:hypothetical protein
LNGTEALVRLLKNRGHEVRVAIRLNETVSTWSGGIVRFATYPGPPAEEEAAWLRAWLSDAPGRWLIYVVRDFDAAHEYWKNIAASPAVSDDPERKEEAEENRDKTADWVSGLPPKAKPAAAPVTWFAVDSPWAPPRICKQLGGPWAEGIDAAAAAISVHEPLKAANSQVLLKGDGKPLVVEKEIGEGTALFIANGSFLINEALANPARRPLAERVVEWADRGVTQVAIVEGSWLFQEAESPTLWDLLKRIWAFRWVVFQVSVAALAATLARAPRLGRPRPPMPSASDRPAEHALALGALLKRAASPANARELLERYRRWRHPKASVQAHSIASGHS